MFERNKIDLEYNFIDINKLSKQILLEKDTMFGYIMFIEKSKNKEDLIENLNIIIKSTKNKERLERLANLISYLLDDVLEESTQEELLEKIDREVGEKNMSTLYERLLAEARRDIQKGKRQSQREIARNMVNKKLDTQIILETTGIKKEELEEIKSKLQIAG